MFKMSNFKHIKIYNYGLILFYKNFIIDFGLMINMYLLHVDIKK